MLKIKNYASWAKALLLFTMLLLGACQKHDFALQSSEIVFTKDVSNVAQWYNSQLISTAADTGFASLNKPDWTKTTVKQVGGTSTFTTPVYTNGAISRDVIIELTGEVYTGVVKEYKKVDKYFTTVHVYSINGKPIEEGYINATNNYHVTKTWQKNPMGSTLRVMDIGSEPGSGGSSAEDDAAARFFTNTEAQPVSETISISTDLLPDPNKRNRRYIWTFAKGATYNLESTEHAIQSRLSATAPWTFDSLTHFSDGLTHSLITGGTFSYHIVDANATVGTYNAIMNIKFNTISTFNVRSVPTTVTSADINSAKVWNVNDPDTK
ncbi:hypothetical protein [Mucilaginibacter paludis]|uniref:DUF5689 domain-containing protein n=1 Tax=Mucilaginibacter paludis DSM 18603 TaxID=714943 RepID=H1Y3T7_9SPHI|nr:hypothetical protein [Mucilaginibacter paludis]EHQ30349.1 hypothetical protein Mucpa_6293 [Mucilaginibacter paludis DSM 18603]